MVEDGLDAIREARRELDEVIKEIQAIPGYETRAYRRICLAAK
jgi:hypothetical protein